MALGALQTNVNHVLQHPLPVRKGAVLHCPSHVTFYSFTFSYAPHQATNKHI